MRRINAYQELMDYPFKLGATFRLVCKTLWEHGYTLDELYNNPPKATAYFIARNGDTRLLLASMNQEFYAANNARLAYILTINKDRTYLLCEALGLPVPASGLLETIEADDFLAKHPKVVVKPANGSNGRGITTGITSRQAFDTAVTEARKYSQRIVVQEQVEGDDYRLLFIDHKFFAAVRRDRASVTGDGEHNLKELIAIKNNRPRDDFMPGTLSKISVKQAERYLGEAYANHVPAKGETVVVMDRNNISLGGEAADVTDQVNANMARTFEQLVQTLDLSFCGVDIISTDIGADLSGGKSYIIEVNAAPNIRPHMFPSQGAPRDAALEVVKTLEKNAKHSIIAGLENNYG